MSDERDVVPQRTLYFVPTSCALGSIIALEWSKLPYRLCRLTETDTKSERYLEINPLGQVPALTVGERTITESAAILNHIGTAADPVMLPGDGTPQRDQFNRVLAFLTTSFHPSFGPLFHPERFAHSDSARNEVRKVALGTIRSRYGQVERWLWKHEPALAPNQGNLAAAYLFGTARWGFDHFDVAHEFPLVGSFQTTMREQPAVQAAQAMERAGEPSKAIETGK